MGRAPKQIARAAEANCYHWLGLKWWLFAGCEAMTED